MGLQFVRVLTRRGWVVVASDVTHFYENLERRMPFPVIYNLADMVRGFDALEAQAETPGHIVPGHDPLVLERYPAPDPRGAPERGVANGRTAAQASPRRAANQ